MRPRAQPGPALLRDLGGIQRQTGGDLAEILDKIGYVIRERFRILGQVKALTGEGRLSGIVLIALPFALFGFMLNIKPDYVESLWTTDLGKKMSVVAIVAQILGALCDSQDCQHQSVDEYRVRSRPIADRKNGVLEAARLGDDDT